jgi:hypothetical protein
MRPVLIVAFAALLVGCQPAVHQPTATTSGAASPSTTPGIPRPAVSLNCRLPVITANQTPYSFSGGFVTFPSGTYEQDPAGVINGVGDGEFDTQAQPVLRAYPDSDPPFYNLAMKRWIPQGAAQASPDGRTYAYVTPSLGGTQSTVNLVTVASGADRVLNVNPGFAVKDFDGRYVYLTYIQSWQPAKLEQGVWRIDSATGSLVQLSQQGPVLALRALQLWVGRINPTDPSPPKDSQGGQLFDSIVQVNLTTGAETAWIYRPGEAVSLIGLDRGGHPVVGVTHGPDFSGSPSAVLLIDAPGDSGTVITNTAVALSTMQADVGRIWFGSAHGIYLWTPADGLQKAYPYAQTIMPAGYCV